MIAREPGFSCLVLLCLALGIGLNTAIFSVIDTLLVRLAVALVVTRLLGTLLYQVEPIAPATFAEITVGLMAVAALASWLPARRASRVDPARSIKQE